MATPKLKMQLWRVGISGYLNMGGEQLIVCPEDWTRDEVKERAQIEFGKEITVTDLVEPAGVVIAFARKKQNRVKSAVSVDEELVELKKKLDEMKKGDAA